MSELTKGRRTPCKESQGGLRKVYLYSHLQYPIQVLQGLKSGLLISHPTTNLLEYEGWEKTATESKDGNGFRQRARIVLPVIGAATNELVLNLLRQRLGLIGIDRNGRAWGYGMQNGLDMNARLITGQNRENRNGYELTFEGLEEYPAPYISNLTTAGFNLPENPVQLGCLYSSSGLPSSIGYLVSDCNVPQSL